MMMMFIALILSYAGWSQSSSVPVLLWESTLLSKTDDFVPALSFMTTREFSNHLLDKIQRLKPLVVQFVEPTLSIEDFSWKDHNHRGVYSQVENETNHAAKVEFLPFIEDAVAAVDEAVMSAQGYSYATVNETAKSATIVRVDLSDSELVSTSVDSRRDLLRLHDATIAQIYKSLVLNVEHVLALYTGRQNPWTRRVVKRQATQNAAVVYEHTSMKIELAKNPVLQTFTSKDALKPPVTLTSDNWPGLSRLNVQFSDGKLKVVLRFVFLTNIKSNTWKLGPVVLERGNSNLTIKHPKETKWVRTGSPFTIPGEYLLGSRGLEVTFVNLRAYKFRDKSQGDDKRKRKPNVNGDETVFFTPIIWMGLTVVFVLGLILAWGITMLLDIKTVDRFDDPKGKSITVNAVD